RGGAVDDRAVVDVEAAAVAGAVDGAAGDAADRAPGVRAHRGERVERARLRLGDHDFLLGQDRASADRDVRGPGQHGGPALAAAGARAARGRASGGGRRGRRRSSLAGVDAAVGVVGAASGQGGRTGRPGAGQDRAAAGLSHGEAPQRWTPNVEKNQYAEVSQIRTRAVNTTAPQNGSTQPGSPFLGRISILTVNAPKNRQPKIEWSSTRVL